MGLGADPQEFLRIQEQIYNTIDYDPAIQRDLRRHAALRPSPGEGRYPQRGPSQVLPPRDHHQATGEAPTTPTDASAQWAQGQGACDPRRGRTGVGFSPTGHQMEKDLVTKKLRMATTRDYTSEDLYSPPDTKQWSPMVTPDA